MAIQKDKLLLLHPTRQEIYKLICESPGQYFYKLISELKGGQDDVGDTTVLYHLKKMEEDGILHSMKINGKRMYFPKNLRNDDVEKAFLILKNEKAMMTFLYIINSTDAYQSMIANEMDVHHDTVRYHLEKLMEVKLIEKEKKGKRNVYRIGELGSQLLDGSVSAFSEAYIRFIISKLSDDCHFPEVIESTRNQLVIRVNCPREDDIYITLDLSDWAI